MIDRYTYDGNRIDEIVASNASVHLERLNERDWSLIIDCGKQRAHLTVRSVIEYEKPENVGGGKS